MSASATEDLVVGWRGWRYSDCAYAVRDLQGGGVFVCNPVVFVSANS